MAESVARSSTTSGISAGKPRASKRSGKLNVRNQTYAAAEGKRPSRGSISVFAGKTFDVLFTELARVAEMAAVERELRDFGFRAVAGTDEVGRGPLAGPVVAAAVILDNDPTLLRVNDSKKLDEARLELCCSEIYSHARAISIGVVEPHVIDRINILAASKLAMRQAVENLHVRPDILLSDAVFVDGLVLPQVPIIDGDQRSISIAAASIVAKVYRDKLMESYHALYPEYDFVNNRGYGTESHRRALQKFGPTPIHRKTFLREQQETLFG